MSSLFVGNLSSHVRHRELENVFRRFGRSNLELKDGFGFVVYEEHRDAKRALEALQGRSLCGEQPSISWARKRRPFQRYNGRPNIGTKDKYQSRRRQSLEMDRGSDDGRRDEKFLDEGKDGSRVSDTKEGAVRSAGKEAEWKDSGPEKPGFDEEIRDLDPLDSGRWDPNMEVSPENMLVDGILEDEEHALHDKDKENEKGSAHEKSPVERHVERSSRGYRNSSDQHKRGRDAFTGRSQERCYNCGQSGHVKWQCRLRPKRISMHSRDGGYDSRRNDSRHFSGRGGFRGISSGRFRGMNGSRRMMTRDIEAGYAKRTSRRHDLTGDRRHYDPVDTKIREKNRRRRHRSESPKDSSSRGRSKRKQKKSNKKSTHSTKKRQRSSSGSPSSSRSTRSSSSSSSGSQSRSAASRSQSSKSGSSSSSGSHSRSSQSQSSRSRSSSASSLSRSLSVSSQSRKSPLQSRSRSPSSGSRASRGISSASPTANRMYSPHSISQRGSRSSTYEEDKEVATFKPEVQEMQDCEPAINNGTEEREDWKHSEDHDMDQPDAKRRERRRVWSREAKRQKRSESEEPYPEAELQSNGVKGALKSVKADEVKDDEGQIWAPQDGIAKEPYLKDSANLKASELLSHNQMADTKCTMYVAMIKGGNRGTSGHDGGQELGTGSFGAARLWPWEALLYRRLKRGPISTANYEKRRAQNEEFGIKDSFVRSSSGWWEKQEE